MTKFFNPEDFKSIKYDLGDNEFSICHFTDVTAQTIANQANKLIEEKAIRVLQTKTSNNTWVECYSLDFGSSDVGLHKALLINIEEINPCNHPKEKVKLEGSFMGSLYQKYYKCACGVEVIPNSYEAKHK